ncbi:MAG: S24 family peptidase [Minicystis sp.]
MPNETRFLEYWTERKNPIDVWISGRGTERWFVKNGGRFVPAMPIPSGDEAAFVAMTREVVDYRLAEYREKIHRETPASALTSRRELMAFPTLRAAAGAADHPAEGEPEASMVRLPTTATGEGLFAVRATGESMNGGRRPIRDGDWLILRRMPPDLWTAVDGEVALCAVPDDDIGESYLLKRVGRASEGWSLRSDNPAHPSYEVGEHTKLLAKLIAVVRPEDLGPLPGAELDEDALPRAFGLLEGTKGGRIEGHLFIFLDRFSAVPQRFCHRVRDLRPGETAFVLVRTPGAGLWRYLGVARRADQDDWWGVPNPEGTDEQR